MRRPFFSFDSDCSLIEDETAVRPFTGLCFVKAAADRRQRVASFQIQTCAAAGQRSGDPRCRLRIPEATGRDRQISRPDGQLVENEAHGSNGAASLRSVREKLVKITFY